MKAKEKLEKLDPKLMLDMDDKAAIQMICSRHAVPVLMELLSVLKALGDMGSSRNVYVEGFEPQDLFFDGDGSDHISSLTVNGLSLDAWLEKQKKRDERLVMARDAEAGETGPEQLARNAEA